MKTLRPLGRILFALPFLFFGLNHFIELIPLYNPEFTSFIPLGTFTIILTGILLIVGSFLLMFAKFVKIAATVLAVLLFLFIVTIHIPHLIQGVDVEYALINLLKDIALMGGAVLIAGLRDVIESN